MPQPFGKRTRFGDVAAVAKPKRLKPQVPPPVGHTKLYLYIAGGALFLLVVGLALAQQ
jgi:hypothetical protein